jgi:hypothetical protein
MLYIYIIIYIYYISISRNEALASTKADKKKRFKDLQSMQAVWAAIPLQFKKWCDSGAFPYLSSLHPVLHAGPGSQQTLSSGWLVFTQQERDLGYLGARNWMPVETTKLTTTLLTYLWKITIVYIGKTWLRRLWKCGAFSLSALLKQTFQLRSLYQA